MNSRADLYCFSDGEVAGLLEVKALHLQCIEKKKGRRKKKKNYWEQNEVCRAIFLKAWTIDDALMSWGQSSDACEISQVITLIRIPPACITISWQINKDCKRAQLLFHMFSRQKVLLNDGKVATQIDKEETLSVVIKLAYVSLPFPVR